MTVSLPGARMDLEEQLKLDELEKRIENFVRLRGGTASSTQVWNAFSKDQDAADIIKEHGGTSSFCKMYSDTFQVGNNTISLNQRSGVFAELSSMSMDSRPVKRSRAAVGGGDDMNLVWRIQNFIRKHGNRCTNDELWECFGSDEEVRPFLIRQGGTRNFLRQHPNVFVVDNDYISLARGGGGGGADYTNASSRRNSVANIDIANSNNMDEGQLVWRIQNFVQKRGGRCTCDEMWETFSQDDEVRRFLVAQGGSRGFLRRHPEAFAVEGNFLSVVGDAHSEMGVSQTSQLRLDASHLLWRIKNFIRMRGGSCTNEVGGTCTQEVCSLSRSLLSLSLSLSMCSVCVCLHLGVCLHSLAGCL
jgi:hypothetical protein